MIKNININDSRLFKSKNAKLSFKKYIKNLVNLEDDKKVIAKTIENHIDDMQKYLEDACNIKFQINKNDEDFDIDLTLSKFTEKDKNRIKLKNKLKRLDNDKNYLANKKEAKKIFDVEKNELKSDDRVSDIMIKLYYRTKYDLPDNSNIPTPINILDNLETYKDSFTGYIEMTESKNELEKYVLLKNNYCNYMSYMTDIKVNIPEDLEERYRTNNLKI